MSRKRAMWITSMGFSALLLAGGGALAQRAGGKTAPPGTEKGPRAMGHEMMMSPVTAWKLQTPGEVTWNPEVPNTGGVRPAPLWGDMQRGPYGALMEFPAGWSHAAHTHSNPMRALVVEGTVVLTPKGQSAKLLPRGSYFEIPANASHATACTGTDRCVIFTHQPGAFDTIPDRTASPTAAPSGR